MTNLELNPKSGNSLSETDREVVKGGKIKVLHVVHWPVSGIVSLLGNIIPLFSKNEIESHILFFYPDAGTLSEFEKSCSSSHTLNLNESYGSGIIKYHRLLKQISPDIVHFHSFLPLLWGSLLSGMRKKICTVHSDYPYFHQRNLRSIVKRTVQKIVFKAFDIKVVAVSKRVHAVLDALFGSP